jgi:hypothetical protein
MPCPVMSCPLFSNASRPAPVHTFLTSLPPVHTHACRIRHVVHPHGEYASTMMAIICLQEHEVHGMSKHLPQAA